MYNISWKFLQSLSLLEASYMVYILGVALTIKKLSNQKYKSHCWFQIGVVYVSNVLSSTPCISDIGTALSWMTGRVC